MDSSIKLEKKGENIPDHGECPASWHGAEMDFSQSMSYGDYLGLANILSAQRPLSPDHNELLFIIQHQTSELWMKLALHEIHSALQCVRNDELRPAFKMLSRVSRIMDQLIHAWSVLSTMTPFEYSSMRPYLGMSSGFQSFQYREIEFLLGNKNAAMLQPHVHDVERHAVLDAAMRMPSLYDEVIRLLSGRGFSIDSCETERDWTQRRETNDSVRSAWLEVYRDPECYWDLYELGEKLVDLEDAFRQWRFRHVVTVERVIGFKRGTGGTEGVGYLRKMLDVVLFPELWQIRTAL